MTKTDAWLQEREPSVDFITSNSLDAPLCVMVQKLLMPVMEGFGGEELAWFWNSTIRQYPISPEGKMDTIEPETLLGLLGILFEVSGVNIF